MPSVLHLQGSRGHKSEKENGFYVLYCPKYEVLPEGADVNANRASVAGQENGVGRTTIALTCPTVMYCIMILFDMKHMLRAWPKLCKVCYLFLSRFLYL